jgi:hypothetical protein
MRFKTAAPVAACVVVMALAVLSIGGVQQPPRQPSDPVAQQVQELRGALDYYFRVSNQIALTAQRANAVQMRMTSLSWELADIRTQLALNSAEATPCIALIKAQGVKTPGYETPEYAVCQRQVEARRGLDEQLGVRESQVAGTLANEQAKWNQLSQHLDALEASIGARGQ